MYNITMSPSHSHEYKIRKWESKKNMARTKYNYPKMTTRSSGSSWKPSRFVMDAIQSAILAANQAAKMGSKRSAPYARSGYNKRRRRVRGGSNYGELAGKFYKVRKVGKKYWKRYAKGKQGEVNATIIKKN
jgi:hypothetical protein